jgi:Mn2+/Fe2+ NRAMP family transporter
MKALFWSAVINGVVAVPLMAVIILLASKKIRDGRLHGQPPLVILGWIATAVMGAAHQIIGWIRCGGGASRKFRSRPDQSE